MKTRSLLWLMMASTALLFSLSGCGGSDSGHTKVSGVASKGLVKNGTDNVKIFALKADGTKGNLLATTSTGPNGDYSADLGYAGPVLVEVSGTYTDEATGQPVTISPDKPMRAAVENAAGTVTVAVTPLTELAVEKAGSALTKDAIQAANATVSTQFNLDIIATKPVDAEAGALSGATAQQKQYTLALAGISQMANSGSVDAVYAVIDSMKNDLDQNNALTQTAPQLVQALEDFAANGNNKTGVTADTLPAALVNVGARTAVVTFGVPAGTIYGVDLVFDLPPGVTVVAGADGAVAPAVLSLLSAAAGSFTVAKYTPASGDLPAKVHLVLSNANGFPGGNFLTLSCAVAPGVTPSFGSSLVESGAQAVTTSSGGTSGAAVIVTATL
ncbi:hypothetical protein [Geomesophilobacter sediminis]|uniref:Lipoprotein n=1 Tax=Geomesophilobacter sediminis TaxID=2798584 RepID=A0A8J7LUU9_9BACT|nr:hypothetical protein [Geomesophilobacter sediminis]MBJ6725069.1 hypothetical protein [Geomesophilobacter sediminis]